MELLSFRIKNKIEIFSYNDSQKIGDSSIQAVRNDCIYVSKPLISATNPLLNPGEQINALYYCEDNKVYGFSSEVIEILEEKNDNIGLKIPKSYVRVQRRNSVRIPLIMDIRYLNIGSQEVKENDLASLLEVKSEYKDQFTKSYSLNLSAGGMGAQIPEAVKENDKLIILLENEDIEIAIVGEIVRAITIEKNEGCIHCKAGIKFDAGSPHYEDKLFEFIFRKMREQLVR